MTADGDGFLSRWARRKAGARSGAPVSEAAVAPAPPTAPGTPSLPTVPILAVPPPSAAAPDAVPRATAAPTASPGGAPTAPATTPPPSPTLDDVARLTPASDFSRFVARDVDAGVRNAAMRKLFADPHFNIMDGLDTYIDDYGKPDPIPLSMLRRMNQSVALGLFSEEAAPDAAAAAVPPAPVAEASPDGADPAAMAESTSPALPSPADGDPRADDDPDLQLQPDDADRRLGARPGPRA